MELTEAVKTLQGFLGADLTRTLARIEASLHGVTVDTCSTALAACGAENKVISAAGSIKHLVGQINVVIHALGVLLCLPHILQPGEVVDYVSLGAGNTGRAFDLETTRRIAEFKFIRWRGGPESIRQNALFKDFYLMAEHATDKRRFLYVLGTEYPLKFFNGGRALSSVLSRNVKLQSDFTQRFGDRYRTVREYCAARKELVVLEDVSPFVPELVVAGTDSEEL